MNYAEQIARLKPTKPPGKHRRCTPVERFDEELGILIKVCRDDAPELRRPLKARKRKSKSCKEYRWAETKLGRQCVCTSTGRKAANRYCSNKKAR